MDSLLESFRILHEEKERLLDEMAQELYYEKQNLKEEINSGHRFRRHLNRYQECCNKLVELYEDKDDLKKEEIGSISGANEFAEFYGRIRNSKEFHRKYPNIIDTLFEEFNDYKNIREKHIDDDTYTVFTDEESYGKFLDLHELFHEFMNMDSIKTNDRLNRLTYLEFLNSITRLHSFNFELKNNDQYESFLALLCDYLTNFIGRAKPLLDIESEIGECNKAFENQWTCGDFPGWPSHLLNTIIQQSASKPDIHQLVNFEDLNTPEKLESLGLDQLKNILQTYGLKCGGTIFPIISKYPAFKCFPVRS
ncbi:Splicing factor 3A subunit 3 [Thelohanellus kitauei]|uniref:Splicing factor 3A subunit 3 n=1 Tax=Thelohanellus kitauei TaxID=669202 RepID=A0A0C2MV66_THEKT|nr:Splicing factor 3A subunit 3 [Thelohanellus kitauei]